MCGSVVRCSHVGAAGLNPCSPGDQGRPRPACSRNSPLSVRYRPETSTQRQVLGKGSLDKLGNERSRLLQPPPAPPLELPSLRACSAFHQARRPDTKVSHGGPSSARRSESKPCFCSAKPPARFLCQVSGVTSQMGSFGSFQFPHLKYGKALPPASWGSFGGRTNERMSVQRLESDRHTVGPHLAAATHRRLARMNEMQLGV